MKKKCFVIIFNSLAVSLLLRFYNVCLIFVSRFSIFSSKKSNKRPDQSTSFYVNETIVIVMRGKIYNNNKMIKWQSQNVILVCRTLNMRMFVFYRNYECVKSRIILKEIINKKFLWKEDVFISKVQNDLPLMASIKLCKKKSHLFKCYVIM